MHCWRVWLKVFLVTLVLIWARVTAYAGETVPDALFSEGDLPIENTPWLVESDEGVWLGGGQNTLFFPGLSFSGMAVNLGLLAGGYWLSQMAVYGAGGMGAVWYAFDALRASGSASWGVELAVPQLSSGMVLLTRPAADDSAVLTILRNPLASSIKLSKKPSRFARVMIDLYREMFRQKIERLDIRLSQDNGLPSLSLIWRSGIGRGEGKLNMVPGSGAAAPGWLELYRFDASRSLEPAVPLISPLQPELMARVVTWLQLGGWESEKGPVEVDVPGLFIKSWNGFFSTVLDSGHSPVIAEGNLVTNASTASTPVFKKIKQLSDDNSEHGGIWMVPRAWSASAQVLFNLLFVGWHYCYARQSFGLVSALQPVVPAGADAVTNGQTKKTRLQLLQRGEVAVTGMAAMAARKVIGDNRILKIDHAPSLEGSNFVRLSRSLEGEMLKTLDSFPWTFELTGQGGRRYWVAMDGNTFSDDSHTLLISPHISEALRVNPGETVDFLPVRLKPLRELSVAFEDSHLPVNDDDAIKMLEKALTERHWTLHQGERIRAHQDGHDYFFKVLKMDPEGVAYTPRCEAVLHMVRMQDPLAVPGSSRMKGLGQPSDKQTPPGAFVPFSGRGYTLKGPRTGR